MSEVHVARWSDEHPGKLVITDPCGNEVDTFGILPVGEQPGQGLFRGTPWSPYPGSEWQEDRPGQWSRSVYRENW